MTACDAKCEWSRGACFCESFLTTKRICGDLTDLQMCKTVRAEKTDVRYMRDGYVLRAYSAFAAFFSGVVDDRRPCPVAMGATIELFEIVIHGCPYVC